MTDKRGERAERGRFLTAINLLLERNRLGELLVLSGLVTPVELRSALVRQKYSGDHLGRVLIEQQIISKAALYRMLVKQSTLRCLATVITLIIAFSSFGGKSARASSIKDVPAQISLTGAANTAFIPVSSYPALFGSEEKRSANLAPFTKWTGMFRRFEAALNDPSGRKVVDLWRGNLDAFKGLPLDDMARSVNEFVNKREYILDNRNWGKSDYWETPVEFFSRGGDCEDFAIAKYASLRMLGVPEERLRVAIVHDMKKDIPHAVLIVYTDRDALILDNQNKETLSSSQISHYRPIFTINRQAWWLHTRPGAVSTIIASSR